MLGTTNQQPQAPKQTKRTPILEMRYPPLPKTVTDVSQLISTQADVPDTPKLVEIITTDPVMAASVLRRVNSAFFGVRRHIGDVRKAVYLLGFMEVCNIVLTAAMMNLRDVVKTPTQADVFEYIMQMCIGAAYYSKILTEELRLPKQDTSFTAGLLHGAGRLVLLYNRPKEYESLWRSSGAQLPSLGMERDQFGMDHCKVGGMAAKQWHLPEDISSIIRSYQMPGHIQDPNLRVIALSVSVSVTATEQLCLQPDGKLHFEAKTALRILARSAHRESQDIVDLLEEKQQEVYDFIHSMLHV